jgi:hypothetical protein
MEAMTYTDNRRDAREDEFIEIIRTRAAKFGKRVEVFKHSRLSGYDFDLCCNGKVVMVEVKSTTSDVFTNREFDAFERAREAGVEMRRVDCPLIAEQLADELCERVCAPRGKQALRMAQSISKQKPTRKRLKIVSDLEKMIEGKHNA